MKFTFFIEFSIPSIDNVRHKTKMHDYPARKLNAISGNLKKSVRNDYRLIKKIIIVVENNTG